MVLNVEFDHRINKRKRQNSNLNDSEATANAMLPYQESSMKKDNAKLPDDVSEVKYRPLTTQNQTFMTPNIFSILPHKKFLEETVLPSSTSKMDSNENVGSSEFANAGRPNNNSNPGNSYGEVNTMQKCLAETNCVKSKGILPSFQETFGNVQNIARNKISLVDVSMELLRNKYFSILAECDNKAPLRVFRNEDSLEWLYMSNADCIEKLLNFHFNEISKGSNTAKPWDETLFKTDVIGSNVSCNWGKHSSAASSISEIGPQNTEYGHVSQFPRTGNNQNVLEPMPMSTKNNFRNHGTARNVEGQCDENTTVSRSKSSGNTDFKITPKVIKQSSTSSNDLENSIEEIARNIRNLDINKDVSQDYDLPNRKENFLVNNVADKKLSSNHSDNKENFSVNNVGGEKLSSNHSDNKENFSVNNVADEKLSSNHSDYKENFSINNVGGEKLSSNHSDNKENFSVSNVADEILSSNHSDSKENFSVNDVADEKLSSNHSEVTRHICNICQETFSRKIKLMLHKKAHANEPTHVTDTCPNPSLEATLRTDLQTKTKRKSFACGKCPEVFFRKMQLRKHMISHCEDEFNCNVCSKVFRYKRHLANHMRSHGTYKGQNLQKRSLGKRI